MDLGECFAWNSTLDCSANTNDFDVQGLLCHLNNDLDQFDTIKLKVPKDVAFQQVDNFGKGESSKFFQTFNGVDAEFNRKRPNLTFYGTKFDLAVLPYHTDPRVTEEVTIKADTVVLTKNFSISYKLNIVARVVSIDQDITMTIPLTSDQAGTHFESQFIFTNNTLMRQRSYGLINIIDSIGKHSPVTKTCLPKVSLSNETDLITSQWFDPVLVNLMYVSASTLQPENNDLASKIANFTLDYHQSKEVVGDVKTFVTAQKFTKIKDLTKLGQAHVVPSFSLSTIKDLSEVMYNRLDKYLTNENNQNTRLENTLGKVDEIKRHFAEVELQQQYYFEQELSDLERIFDMAQADADFSFDHREGIANAINDAMSQTDNQLNELKEQELKQMLAEAQESMTHYSDVVEAHKRDIARFQQKVSVGQTAIQEFKKDLDEAIDNLEKENDEFQDAVDDYKHDALINAIVNFFLGLWNCIAGALTGSKFDITNIIEPVMEMIKAIGEIIIAIDHLLTDLNELHLDDLVNMTINPTTDFMTAIKQASELKLAGPKFDTLMLNATYDLERIDEITNHDIDGLERFRSAHENVVMKGRRITEETSNYADVLLDLTMKNDQLAVAQNDLGRAVRDVERIQADLVVFEQSKDFYQISTKHSQEDYENEIDELRQIYNETSQEMLEKYKEKIMARFDNFKQVFAEGKNNYLNSLNMVVNAAQDKIYGLRTASLNHRSMLMVLYQDYCDGLFYHTFRTCDQSNVPLLGDDMDVLLDKLNNLQWDILVNMNELPNIPEEFHNIFLDIEDIDNYTKPLTNLVETSKLMINLKDYYEPSNLFYKQWRWRIETIKVLLKDANDQVIPSLDYQNGIRMGITFPSVFNDTDSTRNVHTFLTKPHFCRSTYITQGQFDPLVFCSSTLIYYCFF